MAEKNKRNKEFIQELPQNIDLKKLADSRMHRYLYRELPGEEYAHEAILMVHLENPTDYLSQIVNNTLAKKEYKKKPFRNLSYYVSEKNIQYLQGKLNGEYDGQNPSSQCLWILHNLIRQKHTQKEDSGSHSDSEPGIPIKFTTKDNKAKAEIKIDYFNEFLEQEELNETGFKTEQEQLEELLKRIKPSQKKTTLAGKLRGIGKKVWDIAINHNVRYEPKESKECPLNFAKIIYVEAIDANTKLAKTVGSRYISSLDNLVEIEKGGIPGLSDFEFSGVDERVEGDGEEALSKEVGVYYLIQQITSPKLSSDDKRTSTFIDRIVKKFARTTKCPEDIPAKEKIYKEKYLEGKLKEKAREYGREILQEEMIREVIKHGEHFEDLKNTPYAKIKFSGVGYKGYIALVPFRGNLKANPITGMDSDEIEALRKEIRERKEWFNRIRNRNHRLDLCETIKARAKTKEDLIKVLEEYSFCGIYPEQEEKQKAKNDGKRDAENSTRC